MKRQSARESSFEPVRPASMSTTRGVAITTIGSFIPPAVTLASQVLLAHSLGVDGRGQVAASTAPLMLAVALLTLGLPEALTYLVARGGSGRIVRQLGISFAALGVSGLVGTFLIGVLAQPLSAGSLKLAQLITIASAALVPALLTAALRGVAIGAQGWWLVTAERTLAASLQLVAVWVLFEVGRLTPTTATLAIAVTTFIGGVVYIASPRWWAALHGPPDSPEPMSSRTRFGSYAFRIWVGSIAGIILLRLDQVVMTPLVGVKELGIYVVAVNINNVALLFNGAVGQVMFAVESADPSNLRVGRAARMTFLATLFGGGVLTATAPWMIPILFGPEFEHAAPVVGVLALAYALSIPGSVAGVALVARGHPGLRSLTTSIAAVAYVVAMLVLIPKYGALGAALAMLVGTVLPSYANIYLLHRYCDVPLSEFYRFRAADLHILSLRTFLAPNRSGKI